MKSKKEEFLDIIADYQGILHKVSLIYFKNRYDREDNIQEIIYQLWKSFAKLKNHNSIGSWIYAVSINTSLSRLKKNSRLEFRHNIPDLPDQADLADQISANESLKLLIEAIHKLNEIDRSIMLLYLEGKSYEEMAGIIGTSKSNIGVRIKRAKETLKQNLKVFSHGKF